MIGTGRLVAEARVVVLAVMAVAVAGASAAIATASVAAHQPVRPGTRAAGRSGLTLGQAPAGLRAAVHRTLSTPASGAHGAVRRAQLTAAGGAPGDDIGWSVAISGSTAVIGASGTHSGAGAAYVFVHSGSAWSEQAELTASGGAAGDQFGYSVGIAGSTVVVGAPAKDSDTGAAYVFARSGSTWTKRAELTAGSADAAGNYFGGSVAISGSTVLVGADEGGTASGTGAAYVFAPSGSTWTQLAVLTPTGGGAYLFGAAVAISGSAAVVGAYGTSSFSGAAYVFAGSGSSWTQQADLSDPGGAADDEFGSSVAVSGSTAVIGAYGTSSDAGAAYVYTNKGGTWTGPAELSLGIVYHSGAGLDFGSSVAISGSTAVIAAPDFTNASTGEAYEFVQTGSTWSPPAELTGGAAGDRFGNSVAISGSTVLAGAPGSDSSTGAAYALAPPSQQTELTAASGAFPHDSYGWSVAISGSTAVVGADSGAGAAYVYVRSGSTWSQQDQLTPSDTAATFGQAVAISGSTAVVTSVNHASTGIGAAYVFVRSGTTWSQQAELTPSDGAPGEAFGYSVAISGATLVVGAQSTAATGAAYVFVRAGTSWSQQAELSASGGTAGNRFGSSVAISGSTVVAGSPGNNTFTGAAYVFVRSSIGAWTQKVALTAADGATNDDFGQSVALSGSTLVIGATGNARIGAAYVYKGSGGAWSKKAELTPVAQGNVTNAGDFGNSVAISGSTVVVGAYQTNTGAGAAYVFADSAGKWSQQSALPGAPNTWSGHSVAISGSTAVVGVPNPGSDTEPGTAYVYSTSAPAISALTVKDHSAVTLKLSAAKITFGHENAEHLSVQVRSSYVGKVTGKVTITAEAAKGKPAKVCVITLKKGAGSCTMPAKALKAGKYKLIAAYGGSPGIMTSDSPAKTVTVRK